MSDDLAHRAARASKARQELEIVSEAFDQMERAAIVRWASSKDTETDYREALYRSVQVINAVRTHLNTAMSDKDVAAYLEALKQPQD